MENTTSRVTIHMAASLDGFIARKDGRVDWMETSDHFEGGDTLAPAFVEAFLKTIDCYVMGSRTYETALDFEARGLGWATATSRPSSSPAASCGRPGIRSSSIRATSRGW
jgi:dihydrofolate reductase